MLCFIYAWTSRFLKLAPANSSPRRFSMAFRAILVLRLRTANLLLGATLSFSDSNNFHSLSHTDDIYFNFSCFSKKRRMQLSLSIMIRQVYSRLDRTLKVINVFIVHCGSQTKENAMMYVLS